MKPLKLMDSSSLRDPQQQDIEIKVKTVVHMSTMKVHGGQEV